MPLPDRWIIEPRQGLLELRTIQRSACPHADPEPPTLKRLTLFFLMWIFKPHQRRGPDTGQLRKRITTRRKPDIAAMEQSRQRRKTLMHLYAVRPLSRQQHLQSLTMGKPRTNGHVQGYIRPNF